MNNDIAMKGGGYYSLATVGAKHVIDSAIPMVLEAIRRMPAGEGPFVFADMGTADGGTSLDLVAALLEAVRRRWPGREIAVIRTDQPRNDFNALVATVHGQPAVEGIFALLSATSFYAPILPSGSLDLGFSATAMHWLSIKPCDIAGHVQAVGATGEELAAFVRQGNADWQTILLARARELKVGGRLVLANFCRDDQGRYLGHTGGVDMFDSFNRIWREFLAAGEIREDEYRAMTLPQYYKSLPEFTGPLTDPGHPVHAAGLRLERAETRVVPCPFAAEFSREGDAERFAKTYIPTLRSWTESTFLAALDPARPAALRRDIIDRYFASYEASVRANPIGHGMDYVHAYLTVVRV
jgi:hypothetical protein